jgi:hypothetical protein
MKKSISVLFLCLFLVVNHITAQVSDEELDDFLGFDDTVNDVPPASIDVPIILIFMVFWSLFMGYKKYRIDKKYKKKPDIQLKTTTLCHSVPQE